MGPLLVRVLLTFLYADPLELNAGVAAEVRGGQSPIIAGNSPSAFVAGVLTPEGSFDARDPQSTLRLRYYPRLFWQKAAGYDARARPLVLHQAALSLSSKPAATTMVSAQALAAYGEPDYAALPQILPTGQSVLPTVVKIASISGGVGLRQALSRQWQLVLTVSGAHVRPVGSQTPVVMQAPGAMISQSAPAVFIGKQTSLSVLPGAVLQLTTIDALALTVGGTYATYHAPTTSMNPQGMPDAAVPLANSEIVVINPMLTWRRRLDASTELRLGAGLAYAHYLGSEKPRGGDPGLLPTATAELGWRVLSGEQNALLANVRAAFDEYVDPVLGVSGPRFYTSMGLLFQTSADWSAGVQADFSTVWVTVLVPGTMIAAANQPDETSASLSFPVRYRLSNHMVLEAGGRWSDRGQSLATGDLGFHQRQTWAYVSLTVTTRNEGRFVVSR